MSAGVEDSGGGGSHSRSGLAMGRPTHPTDRTTTPRIDRTTPRIPSSPVTATPADPTPPGDPESPGARGGATAPAAGRHHHHVLIDSQEDRWAWRRRIRQNPHQLRFYRVGVGFAGLLLICLGLITGPLPGPGGIPLVLLGLAIWSSEFEWAYRLRQRFKAEIKKFRGWPTRKKVGFWVVFFAVCGSFGYGYLLLLGVPFWMPDVGASLLDHLPGVHGR